METRIRIPIDNTPIIELNAQMKELSERYRALRMEGQELHKSIKDGATDQQEAFKKNQEALKQVSEEMSAIRNASKDLNESQPFEHLASGAKPLNAQLRDVRREMQLMVEAGEVNTDRFRILAETSGRLRNSISGARMEMVQFEAVAGSATDGISNGFKIVNRSIKSLDFQGAQRGLAGVNAGLNALDVDTMSKDILTFSKSVGGTLVNALKTAGRTFVSLGKTILVNPIFLIASAVALIVVAVIKLLKELDLLDDVLGVLKKSFDLLMLPLKALKSGLKQLTDWLGLTNNAEKELARQREERAIQEQQRIEKDLNLKQGQYNREIKLLQAKGDLTDEEKRMIQGLTIATLIAEEQKQKSELKTVEAQIESLKIKRKKSKEEIETLKELEQAYIDLNEAILNTQTDIKVSTKKYENELSAIEKAEQEKRMNEKKIAWEKERAEAERIEEERKKLRLEADQFLANVREEIRLGAIEDENRKALEITLKAIEKERAEILENTQLTEQEKLEIKEYYSELEIKANNDFQRKINAEQEKTISKFEDIKLKNHLEALKRNSEESVNAMLEYRKEAHRIELEELTKEYESIKEEYERQGLDTLELTDFYLDKRNELTRFQNQELEKIRQEDIEESKEQEREKWNSFNEIISNAFNLNKDLLSNLFAETSTNLLNTVGNISSLLDDESLSIADKTVGIISNVTGMISSILDNAQRLNKELLQEQINDLENANNIETQLLNEKLNAGLISQEEADARKFELDMEKYRAEEKIKKEAFEQDKKMQIAQASIAMLQGIVSAFSGAMQLGPIAGPIMGGILAGAVGVLGGINIAKIKSTKYKSGTPPSGGGVKIPSANIPIENNNVSLTDNNSGISNRMNQDKEVQQVTEKVVAEVSISEINNVNKRVGEFDKSSEL